MNENEDLLAIKIANTINDILAWRGQVNTDTHQTESEIDSIPADYTIEAIQGDHAKIHSDLDKIIQTLKI